MTQQLQDLRKNREEAAQAICQKISDKQRQLNEALASATPNPAATGQLEIDMSSLRKQIGAQLKRAANEAIGPGLISPPPPIATPIRGISR